jgi:hypothetical protein
MNHTPLQPGVRAVKVTTRRAETLQGVPLNIVPLLSIVAFVVAPMTPLAHAADGQGKLPKYETVMSPGMKIQATTSAGEIVVTAVDELTRSYRWEGATRSVEMLPRAERWYGSLGLYYPGPGEHWKEHKGITRGVTEEGQQHFKSVDEAVEWIRSRTWMPYVYRDDGLVVGWDKTLPRRQLNVEVWQILVNGKKPLHLPGSQNEKIVVTHGESWTHPLGKAVLKKDLEAVKDLLAGGADPNATNAIGRPVLVEAANRGYHEIVRALLNKGADPNMRGENGSTALLSAVEAGSIETVKALAAGGADVNAAVERGLAKGTTPLMLAAASEHAEVIKTLLEKGADVNAKTEAGLTALVFAREAKREDIVRLLEDADAKD